MGKKGSKQKPKSFADQLAGMFKRNKEARADNPNTQGKRSDQSIADYIGFPGGEDKPKKKRKKKSY